MSSVNGGWKLCRRWLLPMIVGIFVLAADQLSKQWILRELGPTPLMHSIALVGDTIRLVYSQNTGVAFNLFSGFSTFFILTSILISVGIVYIYWRHLPNDHIAMQVSVGLILGGALGNTIDRIRFGFVIDFVQVGWWPVFNVADSTITIGASILALYLFLTDMLRDKSSPSPPPTCDRAQALLDELLAVPVPPSQAEQRGDSHTTPPPPPSPQ